MKAKRVVLIGTQAKGKTTFFNNVTKQNQNTKLSEESFIQQIVKANTVCGQGFEVIDTPGFNSSAEKLLHISGILIALASGEINRILIISKYERNDSIIKNIELVFRPIHKYRQIVTLILSHWDLCAKGQEKQEQIRIKELVDKKFKISSIQFFSKNEKSDDICLELEKIMHTNNQEIKATLNDSEIFPHFELLELNCKKEDLLNQQESKIIEEFRQISELFIKFIKSLEKSNPLFVNILFEITIQIKVEANMKVGEFEKKCGEEILKMIDIQNNNLYYLHYIKIHRECNQSGSIIMKESQTHIYNFLKKCPFCGEIWLKIIGCNGGTICGSQINQNSEVLLKFQSKKKVEVTRNQNNELSVKVNDQITQNQEFLEQMIKFIQQSQFLIENLIKPEQMKKIFQELYGEQFQEILIKQLLNSELENQKLLQTIEHNLKRQQQIEQKIQLQLVNISNTQESSQSTVQTIYPQSSQCNFKPFEQQNFLQQQNELQFNQPQQSQQTQNMENQKQKDNQIQTVQSLYIQNYQSHDLNDNLNNNQKELKSLGCGQYIIWDELPPLTSEELNQLDCQELLNYFANQSQIEKEEEIYWLNKACKVNLNEAINIQQKFIAQLKSPNQEQQIPIRQI